MLEANTMEALDSLSAWFDIPHLTTTELLMRLGIALALGVLIGFERERSLDDRAAPGVRTFALLSLAGALSILAGPIALAAVVLASALVVLTPLVTHVFHTPDADTEHSTDDLYGATTTVTAVAIPVLGAIAMVQPTVASAVAVVITVVLLSKDKAHNFVQDTVTPTELTDAVKFFVVALIVLPLLPDQVIPGTYDTINPHKVGLLVVALTGIGWLGYIAVRAFGARRGLPLAGLAGGFVSSTATTLAMMRRARMPLLRRPAVAASLLAKISSLAVLAVLVIAIDMDTFMAFVPALSVMVLSLLAVSALLTWRLPVPQVAASRIARRILQPSVRKSRELTVTHDEGTVPTDVDTDDEGADETEDESHLSEEELDELWAAAKKAKKRAAKKAAAAHGNGNKAAKKAAKKAAEAAQEAVKEAEAAERAVHASDPTVTEEELTAEVEAEIAAYEAEAAEYAAEIEPVVDTTDPEDPEDDNDDQDEVDDAPESLVGRPFALKPALVLAGIITAVLLVAKVVVNLIGPNAVLAVAAVSGTAETQAPAVAAADLAKNGSITPALAMLAIVAALVANTLVKIVFGFTAGGKKAGMLLLVSLAVPTVLMAATAVGTAMYLGW